MLFDILATYWGQVTGRFNLEHGVSYYNSTVTIALICTVFELLAWTNTWTDRWIAASVNALPHLITVPLTFHQVVHSSIEPSCHYFSATQYHHTLAGTHFPSH